MRLVVADTSPIFYLLSIGQIGLLPQLFGKVFVPDAVYNELCHPTAPPLLSVWTRQPPAWLEVAAVSPIDALRRRTGGNHSGAVDAWIDERKGAKTALNKGFGPQRGAV